MREDKYQALGRQEAERWVMDRERPGREAVTQGKVALDVLETMARRVEERLQTGVRLSQGGGLAAGQSLSAASGTAGGHAGLSHPEVPSGAVRAQAVLAGAAAGGRCAAGCGCPGSTGGAGLSHGHPVCVRSAGGGAELIAPRPPTGAAETGGGGESRSGGRIGAGKRVPGGQRGAHQRHRQAPSDGEPGFGGGAGTPVRHRPGAPAGRRLSAHGQRLPFPLPAAGLRPGEKAQPDPGGHRPTGHRHRSGGAKGFGVGALPADATGRGWLVCGSYPVPSAAGFPVDQLLAGQLVGRGAALFAADGDFEKRHRLCSDQGGASSLSLPHGAKRGRAGGG